MDLDLLENKYTVYTPPNALLFTDELNNTFLKVSPCGFEIMYYNYRSAYKTAVEVRNKLQAAVSAVVPNYLLGSREEIAFLLDDTKVMTIDSNCKLKLNFDFAVPIAKTVKEYLILRYLDGCYLTSY